MNVEQPVVPARRSSVEISVQNSRFIATAAPAFSVEEARMFIDQIRAEYPNASHHVPAYLIGHGAAVTAHCRDDGEPAGTAGRPALSVLQGSGLGDIVVVVTRFFGGTKLGTGGLVRAYTAAVQAVLAAVPRAMKVRFETVRLVVPYPLLERIRLLVDAAGGERLVETFAAEVTMDARFPAGRLADFQERLRELSAGRILPLMIAVDEAGIVPFEPDW